METQLQTTSQINGPDLEGIIRNLKNDKMKAVCLLGAARRGLLSQEGVIDIVETCSSKGNNSEAGEIALRAGNLELAFECYKKSNNGHKIEKVFSVFENNPVFEDRMPELYEAAYSAFDSHFGGSSGCSDSGLGWIFGAARCAEKLGDTARAKDQYELALRRGNIYTKASLAIKLNIVDKVLDEILALPPPNSDYYEAGAELAEEAGMIDRALEFLSKPEQANKAAKLTLRAGRLEQSESYTKSFLTYCEKSSQLNEAEKFCKEMGLKEKADEYALISELVSVGHGHRD